LLILIEWQPRPDDGVSKGFFPRLFCAMSPNKKIHIGKRIREVASERNVSAPELAEALSCTRKHIYKIFQKDSLNSELLMNFSKALRYDFFAEYSKCLQIWDVEKDS